MAIPCHSLLPLASSCASNSSRIDCSWFRSWQHFFAAIRLLAVGARNIGIGHSCHQWVFNWNKHCELSILVSFKCFNFPGNSCTTLSKYVKIWNQYKSVVIPLVSSCLLNTWSVVLVSELSRGRLSSWLVSLATSCSSWKRGSCSFSALFEKPTATGIHCVWKEESPRKPWICWFPVSFSYLRGTLWYTFTIYIHITIYIYNIII